MKGTARVFSGWLAIALMLFTIPELSSLVPSAHAVVITGATPWRPYGAYAKQIVVKVYTNDVTELSDFQAGKLDWYDWTLRPGDVPGLNANPDAAVTPPVPRGTMFQIDINHHIRFFSIPTQQPRTTTCTQIPDCGIGGLPGSTVEPTSYGTFILQALAHLIDKSSFINTGPCFNACVSIDDPIPFPVCAYGSGGPVPPCTTFAQRAAWDAISPSLCSAAMPTNPCAYRVGPGANGSPSAADLQAAKDHLLAAGSAYATATGNTNPLTMDIATGKLNFPASGQIQFAIRSDDRRKLLMGNIVADALDSIFDSGPSGQPVTLRIVGGIRQVGRRVFLSVPPDDWHLYTGSWAPGLDATYFNALYDSAFATDFCGGNTSLFNLNYGFYCNPAFNFQERQATFNGRSLTGFNLNIQAAADIAGKTVMTIPVFSTAAATIAHNGWGGLVNADVEGFSSDFNWMNMYQKAGYCNTPPNCTALGPPGGGNPNLLRAGFRQGTDNLNIFQADTLWERHILGQIYDTPGHFNPRAISDPFFDPYEALLTQPATEVFCTAGTSCATALGQPGFTVPGLPATELVTVVQLVFRNDILFHDGVQLTARDYVTSVLAYRDVAQGGFGEAAAFANLLSPSSTDPAKFTIPGSICGNLCVQLVFDGQSFLNKLNTLGAPILPLHVWDTDGDGFICSDSGVGSCAGKTADFSTAACNTIAKTSGNAAALAAGCIEVTSPDFDPMASGFLIGSGPFLCLDLDTGKPGGSCSQTAAGVKGGQGIGPGGRFLLTRDDNYILCCPSVNPSVESTALSRFTSLDINHLFPGGDHILDILDVTDAIQILHNVDLANSIFTSRDTGISGGFGASLTSLNEIDLTTNTGNAYTIGY